MNEREIERKLAEILASRGNILPGFSSNGGQLGDQLMVSLDGIRDAIQGIALTSIPPGKIGAVFDKHLSQWYILSNEQPIKVREDKTERQNKEKPKQPDSTITLPKTKEYPKILVLHKNPNYNTKLYEYYKKEFKYRMVLEKHNFETLKGNIVIKDFYKDNYYDLYLFHYVLVKNYFYFENLENTNIIKEKYKKCNGQVDVGGDSGSGSESDPFVPEDIKKMDEIIKAHPGYKFNVYWSTKLLEEFYVMSYFWGQYRTNIKAISSADTFGNITPIPSSSPLSHESGGTYENQTNYIKTPDGNFFGWGPYVPCGDVNTCADRTEGNFAEIEYYIAGSIYIQSPIGSYQSLTSVLNKQDNFYGSVSDRECQSLYVPQDNVCWIKVQGTHEYTYNYNITGYQALPPNDPELINDKWPDDDYIGGGGSPPDGWKETCDYPETIENIFNIYKLYFYFAVSSTSSYKKQFHLDIKCRSRTDQEHKVYYSTYTHNKIVDEKKVSYHYDIITQKLINFIPETTTQNPKPTNNYKFIYIDLFYFDETKQEIHNFTVLKYYYGFRIPYDLTFNTNYFLNISIPWEYKIYTNTNTDNNKYTYKEEEVIYYNENTQLIFTEGSFKPIIYDKIIPKMFEDWAIIIENDWRRNISQIYPVMSETGDTECIRNIRNNNFYTVNLIPTTTPPSVKPKQGDINYIDPEQQIKEFENKPIKEIIFSATPKKINIKRIDYDYNIVDNQCSITETGFKIMNVDTISNLESGEYSLEGIIYSKNNKSKTTDV